MGERSSADFQRQQFASNREIQISTIRFKKLLSKMLFDGFLTDSLYAFQVQQSLNVT